MIVKHETLRKNFETDFKAEDSVAFQHFQDMF